MKEKGGVLLFILVGGIFFLVVLTGWYFLSRVKHNTNSVVGTKANLTSSPSFTPILSPSPQEQSQIKFVKLISPLGREKWQVGKTETISWDQYGLDYWGNKVKVCLFAVDENHNTVLPKIKWTDQLCTHKLGTIDGAYLIADAVLTSKKYEWLIPEDFFTRFINKPVAFKVSVQVYDNLPSEGRTEWAGLVGDDESQNYFEISTK